MRRETDRYDGLHFLAILMIAVLQLMLGFPEWMFVSASCLYAVLAILYIESFSKYAVLKFTILLAIIFSLRLYIALYS